MSVLVSGSIAIDNVKTQKASQENLLGGSASYAAIAASFFSPVGMVGVVGHDFPKEHLELFRRRNINLDGVEFSEGETFRWSGEYMEDMNERETLSVALNVLESWQPSVADSQKSATTVNLLANAHPLNQHAVVDQLGDGPSFTIADTMDLWIQISRHELENLLKRIDLLVLNDGEAKLMMDTSNVVSAGHRLREMGPKYVIIKKGEHGAMLITRDALVSLPVYPTEKVKDPTGAGDCFAGGMMAYVAKSGRTDLAALKMSLAYGACVASIAIEDFSMRSLQAADTDTVESRMKQYREMLTLE